MRNVFYFLITPVLASALSYDVHFVGIEDRAALKALENASDLVSLQDRPPASINGLRYRISSDIPNLIKVLRAFAYYDATITSDVQDGPGALQVTLSIRPGLQYTLGSYGVFQAPDCEQLALVPTCCPFTPSQLGLKIGAPAFSMNVVNAELNLLTELARCGYPLASVEKRKVEVDMADKQVHVAACIEEGPFSKFGPTTLSGLKEVQPQYILRKIAWEEGETYNADQVLETQRRLLNTDLFSSVLVSHADELDAAGELPMKLKLTEAKHRQVSIGGFYATVDGPGASFQWTHRNVRGVGEIVSVDGQFSKRYMAGKITFKKPDFLRIDQAYRALGALEREKIRAYLAFNYRLANYIERRIDPLRTISVGAKLEHIRVLDSATNGTYFLIGMPFFGKYSIADNVLDPTYGYTFVYQATPFQSLYHSKQHFIKQRLTTSFYIPIAKSRRCVLALRMQVGSIAGARQENIPLPKLFLGGSEDDLRGYRYKTVSPLNASNQPLGGRSAIFLSVETRFRLSQSIGFVPFADFGTVSSDELPQVNTKWYKSIGAGLRYFAFFGPLRFDVGFPLDRRRGIDPAFRIYASVGQAF